MPTRRGFLGLLAAPAIIRVTDIMPIKALAKPFQHTTNPCAEVIPPGECTVSIIEAFVHDRVFTWKVRLTEDVTEFIVQNYIERS